MRADHRNSWYLWGGAAACLAVLAALVRDASFRLYNTQFTTGYIVFGLILFLALFNWRKKLSMVPVGRASYWLTLHIIAGILVIVVFGLHTGSIWPLGAANRLLAVLFYVVCGSGIVGYWVQLSLPRRMVRSSREIIYERIPVELNVIRGEVQTELLAAAAESGNDTLGRYYLDTLAWYFERPRFMRSHLFGSRRGQHWLRVNIAMIGRYLSDSERTHLSRIAELGAAKTELDIQYAMQSVLKRWTLIHVPAATALLALAVWHLILVHVFAR